MVKQENGYIFFPQNKNCLSESQSLKKNLWFLEDYQILILENCLIYLLA